MRTPITWFAAVVLLFQPLPAAAEPLRCDLTKYKATAGLTATLVENLLAVTWRGEGSRASRTLRDRGRTSGGFAISPFAAPARGPSSARTSRPNTTSSTGVRRMTTQQADPLRAAGVEITDEVIDKNRWYAFWDAPLDIPPPPVPGGREPASQPGAWRAADRQRDPTRRRDVQRGVVPVRTDGRPRSELSRTDDGHLRRRAALHRVSRDQPDSHGRGREDQREVGGLQIRRRSRRILDGADAPGHLARYRRTSRSNMLLAV